MSCSSALDLGSNVLKIVEDRKSTLLTIVGHQPSPLSLHFVLISLRITSNHENVRFQPDSSSSRSLSFPARFFLSTTVPTVRITCPCKFACVNGDLDALRRVKRSPNWEEKRPEIALRRLTTTVPERAARLRGVLVEAVKRSPPSMRTVPR
ncbi:hypothetical protein Y032_0050g1978 [Ancylostoma ceylanicum]|uniref:Uncharacterized protein n=1 Tax=Ancylostoma ceylanicum TaxID=53326 RepID=A0A016U9Q7_9BILA|nr:hypothetical protein Y032_0050g1978 [Ancylostoma ceylanicum]